MVSFRASLPGWVNGLDVLNEFKLKPETLNFPSLLSSGFKPGLLLLYLSTEGG